jgi:hypothetical protein
VCVEHADASFLKAAQNYEAGFLTADELRNYSSDPKTEMSSEFLDEALARGEQCYAIKDGGTLAAYGWYSAGSTPIGLGDLVLNWCASSAASAPCRARAAVASASGSITQRPGRLPSPLARTNVAVY